MAAAKELNVRAIDKGMPLYEIFWEGGGEVPAALKSRYTSELLARQAIKTFQAGVRTKVKASTSGKSQTNKNV